MGKAAWIIIPTVVVIGTLALLWGGAAIAKWIDKEPQEPKSVRRKAELADEAYAMFRDMLMPSNITNFDILTEETKDKVGVWTQKYRKANS